MPNRIIKESIWTSPNLNQVSDMAERHFYRLLPLPDDHGCFEATPAVLKGRCYPTRDNITPEDIAAWQQELEDAGLIVSWEQSGRQYGKFITFGAHQRIRAIHQRKTPPPPEEVERYCRQVSSSGDNGHQPSTIDDNRQQVPSIDRPNPNPNPNPNPGESPYSPPYANNDKCHTGITSKPGEKTPYNPPKRGNKDSTTALNKTQQERFDRFWQAYPKKVAKGAAETAFKKLDPEENLLNTMIDTIELAKKTTQWQDKKYIPHPATWLNEKRWLDQYDRNDMGPRGSPAPNKRFKRRP
ncbi:MAG: hypothetical protein ACOC6S_02605, partial [Chloroflexota bacterium]